MKWNGQALHKLIALRDIVLKGCATIHLAVQGVQVLADGRGLHMTFDGNHGINPAVLITLNQLCAFSLERRGVSRKIDELRYQIYLVEFYRVQLGAIVAGVLGRTLPVNLLLQDVKHGEYTGEGTHIRM